MTSRASALRTLLERRRSDVLERWRELLFGSYPAEAVRFFRAERDGFKNPVGHTLARGTATIFDRVVLGRPGDPVSDAIEAIVRIRAVQDFSPSEAVGFVFVLKRAVREALEDRLGRPAASGLSARVQGRRARPGRLRELHPVPGAGPDIRLTPSGAASRCCSSGYGRRPDEPRTRGRKRRPWGGRA